MTDAKLIPDDTWFSDDAATFGDRVAAAREHAALSQEELARRLGVEVERVRAWEDDVDAPRANRLQMLAGILNVSLMWLLTGRGEGIEGPEATVLESELPDLSEVFLEIRQIKSELARGADQLARLEKRLRLALGRP